MDTLAAIAGAIGTVAALLILWLKTREERRRTRFVDDIMRQRLKRRMSVIGWIRRLTKRDLKNVNEKLDSTLLTIDTIRRVRKDDPSKKPTDS